MRIYRTINDYIGEVVRPSLGEYASHFDIDAIAAAMTCHHDECDEHGNILVNQSGLVERDDIDFWEVAAKHDISEDAEYTATLDENVFPYFPNEADGPIEVQAVTIRKNGVEHKHVLVEPSEEAEPYDIAVSNAIDGADFTWTTN